MQPAAQAVRPNPVKEFFQKPKTKGALKITAVALAAIAAVAGLIALSLFFPLASPLVGIALVIGSIVLAVTIHKVKKALRPPAQPQNPRPVQQEIPLPQPVLQPLCDAQAMQRALREVNKEHMMITFENYAGTIDRLCNLPPDRILRTHEAFIHGLSGSLKTLWRAGSDENSTNIQMLEFIEQVDRFNEIKDRILGDEALVAIRPQLEAQFIDFFDS
ncbi:MAG: hypothetical protein ACK5MA_04405 [Parachlamydiaceae bacterium]